MAPLSKGFDQMSRLSDFGATVLDPFGSPQAPPLRFPSPAFEQPGPEWTHERLRFVPLLSIYGTTVATGHKKHYHVV